MHDIDFAFLSHVDAIDVFVYRYPSDWGFAVSLESRARESTNDSDPVI